MKPNQPDDKLSYFQIHKVTLLKSLFITGIFFAFTFNVNTVFAQTRIDPNQTFSSRPHSTAGVIIQSIEIINPQEGEAITSCNTSNQTAFSLPIHGAVPYDTHRYNCSIISNRNPEVKISYTFPSGSYGAWITPRGDNNAHQYRTPGQTYETTINLNQSLLVAGFWTQGQIHQPIHTGLGVAFYKGSIPITFSIDEFKANPNLINYDGSSNLTWGISTNDNNATCTILYSNNSTNNQTRTLLSSFNPNTTTSYLVNNITERTEYTLRCHSQGRPYEKSATVNVLPPQTPLNASCVSPHTANLNQEVKSEAFASGGVSPYTYQWHFDNSSNKELIRSYSTPGIKNGEIFTVTDAVGSSKTVTCNDVDIITTQPPQTTLELISPPNGSYHGPVGFWYGGSIANVSDSGTYYTGEIILAGTPNETIRFRFNSETQIGETNENWQNYSIGLDGKTSIPISNNMNQGIYTWRAELGSSSVDGFFFIDKAPPVIQFNNHQILEGNTILIPFYNSFDLASGIHSPFSTPIYPAVFEVKRQINSGSEEIIRRNINVLAITDHTIPSQYFANGNLTQNTTIKYTITLQDKVNNRATTSYTISSDGPPDLSPSISNFRAQDTINNPPSSLTTAFSNEEIRLLANVQNATSCVLNGETVNISNNSISRVVTHSASAGSNRTYTLNCQNGSLSASADLVISTHNPGYTNLSVSANLTISNAQICAGRGTNDANCVANSITSKNISYPRWDVYNLYAASSPSSIRVGLFQIFNNYTLSQTPWTAQISGLNCSSDKDLCSRILKWRVGLEPSSWLSTFSANDRSTDTWALTAERTGDPVIETLVTTLDSPPNACPGEQVRVSWSGSDLPNSCTVVSTYGLSSSVSSGPTSGSATFTLPSNLSHSTDYYFGIACGTNIEARILTNSDKAPTITTKSASECAATDTLSVSCSANPLQVQPNEPTTITASPQGGTTPYQYQWGSSSYSSNNSITRSSPTIGTHTQTVRVRDANDQVSSITNCSFEVADPGAPIIKSFSANPSNVKKGESTNLSWEAENADGTTASLSCSLTSSPQFFGNSPGQIFSGPHPPAGKLTVNNLQNEINTFTLKCYNSNILKNSAPDSAIVTTFDTPNPPLSVSCSPQNSTINSSQTRTLTASASGGSSPYTYSWEHPDNSTSTGSNATYRGSWGSGRSTVTVTDSTNVTSNNSCLVTVNSSGVPTVSISSSVSNSPPGGRFRLSWTSENADSCYSRYRPLGNYGPSTGWVDNASKPLKSDSFLVVKDYSDKSTFSLVCENAAGKGGSEVSVCLFGSSDCPTPPPSLRCSDPDGDIGETRTEGGGCAQYTCESNLGMPLTPGESPIAWWEEDFNTCGVVQCSNPTTNPGDLDELSDTRTLSCESGHEGSGIYQERGGSRTCRSDGSWGSESWGDWVTVSDDCRPRLDVFCSATSPTPLRNIILGGQVNANNIDKSTVISCDGNVISLNNLNVVWDSTGGAIISPTTSDRYGLLFSGSNVEGTLTAPVQINVFDPDSGETN